MLLSTKRPVNFLKIDLHINVKTLGLFSLKLLLLLFIANVCGAQQPQKVEIDCKIAVDDSSPSFDKKNSASQNLVIKVDFWVGRVNKSGNMEIYRDMIDPKRFVQNLIVSNADDFELAGKANEPKANENWRQMVSVSINRYSGSIEILERFRIDRTSNWILWRGTCRPHQPKVPKF